MCAKVTGIWKQEKPKITMMRSFFLFPPRHNSFPIGRQASQTNGIRMWDRGLKRDQYEFISQSKHPKPTSMPDQNPAAELAALWRELASWSAEKSWRIHDTFLVDENKRLQI
jgi:hypothetical protein